MNRTKPVCLLTEAMFSVRVRYKSASKWWYDESAYLRLFSEEPRDAMVQDETESNAFMKMTFRHNTPTDLVEKSNEYQYKLCFKCLIK